MANQYLKPYIESSVFIAWIRGETRNGVNRKNVLDHIISLAVQGEYHLVTSYWTLAEVHKRKNGDPLTQTQDEHILSYFEHDYIIPVVLDREIGEEANRLARKYGLKPTDSVHLASALKARCDVLLTYDPDFLKLPNPPLRIEEPQIIPTNPLPLYDP